MIHRSLYLLGAVLFIAGAVSLWLLPAKTCDNVFLDSEWLLLGIRVFATFAGFLGARDCLDKVFKKGK